MKLTRSYVIAALAAAAMLSACGGDNPAKYVASAQEHLAKKNYNAAVIELKNALKLDPNRADARFLLARAMLDAGRPVDAETEARKALELKYPVDDALPVLVHALVAQGEYRKALIEAAERRVESPKARAEIETSRSLAFLGVGDRSAARGALDAALAADPNFAAAKMTRVKLTIANGDLPGALLLVDEILASNPGNVEALGQKAELQTSLGRGEDGIATLRQAVAAAPDNAALRWALVFNLVNATKVDDAAKEVAAAKKIAPEDPRTWFSEAYLAYGQGNFKAASELIERAKQSAPDYMPAIYLSGLIDFRLGKLSTAETSLRTVVAKVPEDTAARRALAAVYMQRGRSAQALETLEPALRSKPNDAPLLRAAAEVHLAGNDPKKAAEFFARANRIDSGNVKGQVRLAQVNLSAGDAAQALRDLERLTVAEPASTEADLALIAALLQRREYNKALAAANALEKKQPQSAATHNVKGVVYMTSRDMKNARASFEKAVSLNPDFVAAAYNLVRLDLMDKNYGNARTRVQAMLAKDAQNEALLLTMVEILAATNAPATEISAAIERSIAANPTSVKSRVTLLAFLAGRKDWPNALVAAQKAQAALPDNAQIAEAAGLVQSAAGEPHQAIATLKLAAQLSPGNPAPLVRQAEVQVKLKDYDGAIQALRAANELQPNSVTLLPILAGVYVEAGRSAAGIEEARRLQKQRPEGAIGFALEGELEAREKKWPGAIAAYRSALARQSTTPVAIRLVSLLEAGGKTDEAAMVTQRWIREHPKDVAMRAYVAEAALRRKDYQTAAQHLRAAVEIDPENALLLNNLGYVLGELGDPKALDYAAKAHALAPNLAETNDTYGWLLVQKGQTAEGVELLRRATELAPNDSSKRMRLARALVKAGDKAAARKELAELSKPETAGATRAEAEKMLKDL